MRKYHGWTDTWTNILTISTCVWNMSNHMVSIVLYDLTYLSFFKMLFEFGSCFSFLWSRSTNVVANDLLYVAFFLNSLSKFYITIMWLTSFWAINFYFKLLDWLCWFEHCCSHECIFFGTTIISSMSTWPESCFEITYLGRYLQPDWFILHKSDSRFSGHLI